MPVALRFRRLIPKRNARRFGEAPSHQRRFSSVLAFGLAQRCAGLVGALSEFLGVALVHQAQDGIGEGLQSLHGHLGDKLANYAGIDI